MTAYSTNELIARLRNGDEEAFQTLFWEFHNPVIKNVRRIIGDSPSVEDIVQEVFLGLWENRRKMVESGDVKGWLFRVSYNKSVDYLKAVSRRELMEAELSYLDPLSNNANFEEEQSRLLREAIGRLSPQQKRVFELCRIKQKTYNDAAGELNISRHTVKEYLSDATRSVKASINMQMGEGITGLLVLVLQFVSV